EALAFDDVDAAGEAVELRLVPGDRERNRRVEEHAEVVGVAGVLDEVAEIGNHHTAERLLDAELTLVASSRLRRLRLAEDAVGVEAGGQQQVLVVRRLEG